MGDLLFANFGQFLRYERENAGISLRELARRVDISPTTACRIERDLGKYEIDAPLCERIATAIGHPVDRVCAYAGVLPADMQDNLFEVIDLYRDWEKRQEQPADTS